MTTRLSEERVSALLRQALNLDRGREVHVFAWNDVSSPSIGALGAAT